MYAHPITIPMIAAMCQSAGRLYDVRCIYLLGDFCNGTEDAMIVSEPLIRPEDPIPAIARAMINILEDVESPQIRDPSSKMKKKDK